MLKTVYRNSCPDKHNCQRRDSNLDPLTPQSDALTTRLLRPAVCVQRGSTLAFAAECRAAALLPLSIDQSCPWVGLTHGLGWVESFQFLVGRVALGPL